MSTNYKQPGAVMEYSNAGANLSAGDVVLIGSRLGVCEVDIASNSSGSVAMEGVFLVPKADDAAWTQGALIYWDAADEEFNTSSSGNTLAGYAFEAAAESATSGLLKLNA